jgi:nucleotide-binding universal stress UspA family protein
VQRTYRARSGLVWHLQWLSVERVMIIRSIVCPVDFSSESRTLVRAALAIARQEAAIVTVVHVLEPLLAQAAALSRERDWLEKEAYKALDALIVRALEGSGIDPQTVGRRVRCGEADAEILAAAAEFHADLLVMGTEALRGVRRMFFGSVAARVLAQTEVPVLALPPFSADLLLATDDLHPHPVRHMLVAVDFSDTTMIAVKEAADLAHRWGASLTLLHVVPELPAVVNWREALDPHQRRAIERARQELELVAREISGVPVTVLTVAGAPEESITRVAGEQGSSLVALGLRRSRKGWFAPRPGSTAYRVLSLTTVPILVVPGTHVGKTPAEEPYACASGHF